MGLVPNPPGQELPAGNAGFSFFLSKEADKPRRAPVDLAQLSQRQYPRQYRGRPNRD